MATTNKKAKKKTGTKSKGRTSSANKDYIGSATKNSKGKGTSSKSTSSKSSKSPKKSSRVAASSKNTKGKAGNNSRAKANVKQGNSIRGEIIAIITLVLGVFFAVAMHTDLTGIIGDFIGKFFRGMFGIIGYLIPYTMIIASCMVF